MLCISQDSVAVERAQHVLMLNIPAVPSTPVIRSTRVVDLAYRPQPDLRSPSRHLRVELQANHDCFPASQDVFFQEREGAFAKREEG